MSLKFFRTRNVAGVSAIRDHIVGNRDFSKDAVEASWRQMIEQFPDNMFLVIVAETDDDKILGFMAAVNPRGTKRVTILDSKIIEGDEVDLTKKMLEFIRTWAWKNEFQVLGYELSPRLDIVQQLIDPPQTRAFFEIPFVDIKIKEVSHGSAGWQRGQESLEQQSEAGRGSTGSDPAISSGPTGAGVSGTDRPGPAPAIRSGSEHAGAGSLADTTGDGADGSDRQSADTDDTTRSSSNSDSDREAVQSSSLDELTRERLNKLDAQRGRL